MPWKCAANGGLLLLRPLVRKFGVPRTLVYAVRQGAVGFNRPFNRWVIGRVGKDPQIAQRVPRMIDRQIDPDQLVPMPRLLGWMGAALLRGRFDVLSGFLDAGKHRAAEAKEIAARRALRAQAQAALTHAVPIVENPRLRRAPDAAQLRV